MALDEKKRDKVGKDLEPIMTYTSKNGFNGLDHHRDDPVFATASNTVQIWDEQRTAPVSTLQFGSSMETVSAVKFNQSETSVLASVGGDRTLCLYDIRTGKAERRIVMQVSGTLKIAGGRSLSVPLQLHLVVSHSSHGTPPWLGGS